MWTITYLKSISHSSVSKCAIQYYKLIDDHNCCIAHTKNLQFDLRYDYSSMLCYLKTSHTWRPIASLVLVANWISYAGQDHKLVFAHTHIMKNTSWFTNMLIDTTCSLGTKIVWRDIQNKHAVLSSGELSMRYKCLAYITKAYVIQTLIFASMSTTCRQHTLLFLITPMCVDRTISTA